MALGGKFHAPDVYLRQSLGIKCVEGSKRVRKISPQPGFNLGTVQPVASYYAD